jgi:hypothetical protein
MQHVTSQAAYVTGIYSRGLLIYCRPLSWISIVWFFIFTKIKSIYRITWRCKYECKNCERTFRWLFPSVFARFVRMLKCMCINLGGDYFGGWCSTFSFMESVRLFRCQTTGAQRRRVDHDSLLFALSCRQCTCFVLRLSKRQVCK